MLLDIIKYFLGVLIIFPNIICSKAEDGVKWNVEFDHIYSVNMGEPKEFTLTINGLNRNKLIDAKAEIYIVSSDPTIVQVSKIISPNEIHNNTWHGCCVAEPISLGTVTISVQIRNSTNDVLEESSEKMSIFVDRYPIFNPDFRHFVYVNRIFDIMLFFIFGTALNLTKIKCILRNPSGACCAFLIDFILLPFSGAAFAWWTFPEEVDKQFEQFAIGLMLLGVLSASNCWTAFLGGNVDLSIVISLLAALMGFGMTAISLYIGKTAFEFDNLYRLMDPYRPYRWSLFFFVIPTFVGMLLRLVFPRLPHFSAQFLKWVSPVAILVNIFFDIIWDLDLIVYRMFTRESLLAGILWPLVIYILSWIVTLPLRMKSEDRIAIIVEAINKNMFFVSSIFCSALSNEDGDFYDLLRTSVFVMTPIPLLGHFIIKKIANCSQQKQTIHTPI